MAGHVDLTSLVSVDYKTVAELQDLLAQEKHLLSQAIAVSSQHSGQWFDEIRVRFIGKRSSLQELLKSIKNLPVQDRKEAGQVLNFAKKDLEEMVEQYGVDMQKLLLQQKMESEKIDLSLPPLSCLTGAYHPVSLVLNDLLQVFRRMGFCVVDGPELETEEYNFDKLNIPASHPARDMQDTFFLKDQPHWLLRTHTSNVQIHKLMNKELPLRIVCPGFVYRNESDATHLPAFRQIECLVVDKGVHMGHLRSLIQELLSAAFRRRVEVRLRSSFFPFTEPSCEVDVQCQQCFGAGCRTCKGTGWAEIGGAGVVHKNVLTQCGIDASVYSGIAFGFGLERIAKDRFAVADLRSFSDGYLPFLQAFAQGAL